MRILNSIKLFLLTLALLSAVGSVDAQSFDPPAQYELSSDREVTVATTLAPANVTRIELRLDGIQIAVLGAPRAGGLGFLVVPLDSVLLCDIKQIKSDGLVTSGVPCSSATVNPGNALVLRAYSLRIAYKDANGDAAREMGVVLTDPNLALDTFGDVKADSDEDANYYVSGNITGAHKKKTAFTTQIKIQPYQKAFAQGSVLLTPFFFKLNASTAADADPDSMEIGLSVRKIFGSFAGLRGAYFDNAGKLESEKDFDNTNLVYDGRLIFLPEFLSGKKKGSTKVIINPFVGAEFGKNLKSPLAAAEGDGIGRLLAGADLRVAFLKGGKPWANWTTSFTRRWLLSNELGYTTGDDDALILVEYGKAPRDYFESKFSFKVNTFANAFIAYDWGAVPPSYKKVDHRFRLGFEFQRKTVIQQ